MIDLPTDDEPIKVIQGDCLDVLRQLPDGCVDAVITDPPYSSGGAFRGDRTKATEDKYVTKDVRTRGLTKHEDFGGDTRDQHSFRYWETLWMAECLRICKPGGVLCTFTDWRQLAATTDAVQAGGWVWRGVVVWDKTEAAFPQPGRFRNQAEYVVWGSSGPMPLVGGHIGALPGVFRYRVDSREKLHQTGKPVALMRDLVAICPPGGLILDPFAGSGTTGLAAEREGRKAILIEKEPAYCDIIRRRLSEAGTLFAGV